MNFKPFDTAELESYAAEAKAKWGKTDAYKEYEQKAAGQSKAQQKNDGEALMAKFAEVGALRHLHLEGKGGKIGIEGNIGQTATVLEDVTDRSGLVKLRGEHWTARAELAGQTFAVGDLVTVMGEQGAAAISVDELAEKADTLPYEMLVGFGQRLPRVYR